MKKISILIPVYNAENSIALLCGSLITLYSRRYELEIVLVNDCSIDHTDSICRKLHEEHPGIITYILLPKNFGEHNALMAGLHYVTGDYCVMMDDDLQNPPEEVAKLIDEMQKGFDVVYTYYPSKKDSLFRRAGSRFSDRVATLLLRKPRNLYLSSFKVINRFLVNEIIKHDSPNPYIDGIVVMSTSNIGSVSVMHRERSYNRSGYTLAKLVSLWGNMVVSFSLIPLRFAGIAGTLLIIFALGYGLHKTYDTYNISSELTDFETLMSANMFFRGVVLLAISILGEYVGRIYQLLHKNPQYVIREVLTSPKKAGIVSYIRAQGQGSEK
ncbi:MAG: glycosyltransferase [Nitrospirae bacterium]|nr:MAG: glycosyltransferase [Nitrospirota bacterium]